MVITTEDLQVYAEESTIIHIRTTGTESAIRILATRLMVQGLEIRHEVPEDSLDDDSLVCISIEAGSATVPKSLSILPRAPLLCPNQPAQVYRAHNHRVCCLPAFLLTPFSRGRSASREGASTES